MEIYNYERDKIVINPTIKVEIINMIENKVKLINNDCAIDINNDDMLKLYNMIKFDTGLINIGNMIINDDYVWSNIYYYYFNFPDDSDDDDKIENKDLCDNNFIKHYKDEPTILSILGKNYNKDYVTVKLILFSHIHYINYKSSQHIILSYITYINNGYRNETISYNRYEDNCNEFKENIAKLNNERITLHEYEQIKRFLKRRLKMYDFNNEESINIFTFMLNEIKKYQIL